MKYYYTLLFIFVFTLFSFQSIGSSGIGYTRNGEFNISIFEDPSGKLEIENVRDILVKNPGLFLPAGNLHDAFDPSATYWLYIQPLHPESNQEYVLTFNLWLSHILVYNAPYSYVSNYGGKMVSSPLRELSGSSVYLNAGINGYLVKIRSEMHTGASLGDLRIIPTHIFQKKKEAFDLLQGILIGFFWLMLFYNLLLYIIMRKRVYLFYVIYIFLNSFYMLYTFSYTDVFFFPDNCNINQVFFTFQPISLFFYLTFIRLMLLNHCSTYTTAIDRKTIFPYSYLILLVNLIITPTIFFRIGFYIAAFQISNLINCIIGIIILCYFYKKSDRIMHIIIAGSFIMIIFGIRGILNIPTDVVVNNFYYEIGLLIELLFFSYAINREYQQDTEKRHLAEMKKQQLENELENKNRELVFLATRLLARNEAFSVVTDKIKGLKLSEKNNTSIFSEIKSADSINKNLWEEFELHFSDTYPGFYKALLEKHPELTQNELRLCAFLKLNLNTKEIATITQKTSHSIEAMRSRIRQKMNLDRDANLNLILAQI